VRAVGGRLVREADGAAAGCCEERANKVVENEGGQRLRARCELIGVREQRIKNHE